MTRALSLVVACGVALAARPARGAEDGGLPPWPQPAAGVSASGGPELVLTFDDGPDQDTTPAVLEILRARRIRAVFFQVGWHFRRGNIAAAISTTRRMVTEGHIIANHTITHAHLCLSPPERIAAEIVEARALLEEAAAMPVPWFRTPYGARCPRLEAELAALGIEHFHWDIDPQEWQGLSPERTANEVAKRILRLRDDERAVVLMHDTKVTTPVALPMILSWIDAENERRAARGQRPIRIVPGDELAREKMAPTLAWLGTALGRGRATVETALAATIP